MCLFLGASAIAIGKQAPTVGPKPIDRDWSDNFDSYTDGQLLDGTPDDGGWKGWDNNAGAAGMVTTAYAHSPDNSDQIWAASDNVHEYSGYTSGQWIYTAWQYIPTDFSGMTYFIMLCDYNDGGPYTWVVQVHFDSSLGLVESEFAGDQLPLVTGRWVEIRCEIDLDSDWLKIYYDGTLLSEHAYTDTVQGVGGGTLNIAAVDLFAYEATPVYYDDISLLPPGAPLTCDAGGPYTGQVGNAVQFAGNAAGGTAPYTFDWDFGDGSPHGSGQNPTHVYASAGTYTATLIVTDAAAHTATDSADVTITAPAPNIVVDSVAGGFGVSAVLKNTGTADATGVSWKIELSGGLILFGKSKTGTTNIKVGESATVKSMVFGLGKTTITVTADTATKTATGTVFLFFVLKVA